MTFRKAKMSDVESLHALINDYADKGLMLPRSRNTFYENLREYTVACQGDKIVACGSLHIVWDGLAEVRSLAVAPDLVGKGVGRAIIKALLDEARELDVPRVFALTYQPGFFDKCGFGIITKEELPQKVWKECINCPKFPNCDEIAMVINLT